MFKIISIKLICALTFSDLNLKIDDLINKGYQPYQDTFQQYGDEKTNGYDFNSDVYVCQKMIKNEK